MTQDTSRLTLTDAAIAALSPISSGRRTIRDTKLS